MCDRVLLPPSLPSLLACLRCLELGPVPSWSLDVTSSWCVVSPGVSFPVTEDFLPSEPSELFRSGLLLVLLAQSEPEEEELRLVLAP